MKSILISCVLIIFPASIMAEVAYITNQWKAGLHEDKSLESPIVKIVATGTRLEIVKREDQLTFVRAPGGATGWINNDYLMAKAPDDIALKKLQTRTSGLEQRLAEVKERNLSLESELKTKGKVLPKETRAYADLKTTHAELEQQYRAEKLKGGKLQIELTELRNRVGQNSDTDTLYRQIKTLEEDKMKLEITLANTLEQYEAEGTAGFESRAGLARVGYGFNPGLRNMTIYLIITLVLGVFAGAYLMDVLNRRRHGGFRI